MALRVGVLFSQTGVTSVVERTQLAATQLAVEEANQEGGVHGRLIEPIMYDPGSDPAQFRRYGQRLVEDDAVSIIFGCYMSSARKAVLPTIERRNALLCYPTFYEGFEFSENVLYFGSLPNQTHGMLADFAINRHGGRAFLIGSDYLFPRESNRLMRSILDLRGGTVAGEIYLPLDSPASAFELAMAQAEAYRPDFIFSTVVGNDIAKLYHAFRRQGLDPMATPIVSVTATEAELSTLPAGIATGHITAAPYFSTVDTSENNRFLSSFRRRFGTIGPVSMSSEAAYVSVRLVTQAARSISSSDPRALIGALRGIRFDAPQGPVRIDAENNHTYLFSRIGQFRDDGRFEILLESAEAIKPDPYFVESGEVRRDFRRDEVF